MKSLPKLKASVVAVMLATASLSAHAVLERVGPTSITPSVGGFPAWYQDTSGLALEFCGPLNQAEVDGGWCLLLPGDVPVVPEVFPTAYFDEHFWFAAGAAASPASGGRALLTLAVEAAFAVDAPRPGDQVAFSRIRVVLNPVPVTGTYRVIHPYGEELIQAEAGGKIFYTEDIGINCAPGQFDCATQSRLGPFLLPSAAPGGAEMPPLTAENPTPDTNPTHFGGDFVPTPYPNTGRAYIADPGRIGPVTGSPLPDFTDSTGALRNHNVFRIEGPAGSGLGVDPLTGATVDYVETSDFSLMGRVFTGSIPSRIDVDRATYARNATQKLDVFATVVETTQGRVPAQPRPAPIEPQLTFYDAPCAGVTDPVTGEVLPPYSAPAGAVETQMFATSPGMHWGQVQPAAIPPAVCIKDSAARDAGGNIVPAFIQERVTDEVTITNALYDRGTGTLTVAAVSSDETVPPTLTLAYGTFRAEMTNGQLVVPNLIAPPPNVRVFSSAFGTDASKVTTGLAEAPPPTIPVAANDSFTFDEDAGAQTLAILANDSGFDPGSATLTSAPRLGTATLNPDGSVTYTANLNANGADQFTYTVASGAQVSNTATVTLNITPVNDPPVAVANLANAVVNIGQSINVLGNDTDPDGAADLANAVLVTPPAAGATVTGGAGGLFDFLATAPGTYTFTYRAQDLSGAVSNETTVTVQAAAAENLAISRTLYERSKNRIRIDGSINPSAGQTITVEFINSAGTVLGLAGTTTPVNGAWTLDRQVAMPVGTTSVKATTSNGTVRTATLTIK